jgi:hypothetical protein
MAKGFADVSEIIGCMLHSCNTSPGDTASPTFILFNTTGTESKGYVNHTKIMDSKPAENPTKQLWQLNHIRGIYSLSSAFVFPKGDAHNRYLGGGNRHTTDAQVIMASRR